MTSNAMTITPRTRPITKVTPAHVGELSHLPRWLQMLVGAFPKSWANEMTYLVFDRRFSPYGERVMSSAVDAYTDDNQEFPTVMSLRPYVARFAPQDDKAAFVESMKKAGYVFGEDTEHVMHFTDVSTGRDTEVSH